ncbi:MAG: zinc-ribbon domain containing protein [bacterium]|nr:zinc-ribbon domain containing protein [bacterium]
MDFNDIQIKCATCGREFIFTAREQEFFSSKGFKEPRHCRECRQLRKHDQEKHPAEGVTTGAQPPKNAHKVVCAQCQRETFVPFKPITGKPVLCKDCFIAQRYGTQPKPPVEEAPDQPVQEQATVIPVSEQSESEGLSSANEMNGTSDRKSADNDSPTDSELQS